MPYPKIGLAQIEIVTHSNVAAARAELRKIPAGVDPDGEVTLANWNLSMLERDWPTAEKCLADFPAEEFPDAGPKSFYQAQTALARGDVELARTLFEKLRPALESDVRAHPENSATHSALGRLYAFIGRKRTPFGKVAMALNSVRRAPTPSTDRRARATWLSFTRSRAR